MVADIFNQPPPSHHKKASYDPVRDIEKYLEQPFEIIYE